MALDVVSPADGSIVDTAAISVEGIGPPGATITHDIPFGSDDHTTADASGDWSFLVELSPGTNVLKFRVGDDTSTEVAVTVVYSVSTPTPAPTPASTPRPQPTPTPAPQYAFNPFKLIGSGTRIVRFKIPEDVAAIAQISETGTSNFVVWTIDSTGSENDLLVNTIGVYVGTRLFDGDAGEHSVAFKIESNGHWTIVVKPVELAAVWNTTAAKSGKGDSVLLAEPSISGFSVSDVSYKGSSNFAVWSWADDGRDLQVNEIGSYKGQILWPDDTILVEIEADGGTWSISAAS